MRRIPGSVLWALGFLVACFPTTTRPPFSAVPSAPAFDIELLVPQATRALALALDADSIPVRRTEAKDGWLETDWFDVHTLRATTRRPLGPEVVKVRAFIDPSRPNHSNITIETVFRPIADPSRADRELEQQVPPNSVVLARVVTLMTKLARQYGGTLLHNQVRIEWFGENFQSVFITEVDTSADTVHLLFSRQCCRTLHMVYWCT